MNIAEHDWLGIAGLVVGIIGIVLAIYFYYRSKRKVRISYTVDRTQLLGGHANVLPQEVTISYGDAKINNLTKDNLIIWNSGTEPITRTNIISPTLICLPDDLKLLKISELKSSPSQNHISFLALNDTQKIHLDFEYLEPRQGFNVELLLTGNGGQPTLSGVILGMPNGFQHYEPQHPDNILSLTAFSLMFLSGIIGLVGLLFFDLQHKSTWFNYLITGILFLSIGLLFASFYRPGRRGIPADLRT
jgi:hypothetical protein